LLSFDGEGFRLRMFVVIGHFNLEAARRTIKDVLADAESLFWGRFGWMPRHDLQGFIAGHGFSPFTLAGSIPDPGHSTRMMPSLTVWSRILVPLSRSKP
jgi:hypothetical protein